MCEALGAVRCDVSAESLLDVFLELEASEINALLNGVPVQKLFSFFFGLPLPKKCFWALNL